MIRRLHGVIKMNVNLSTSKIVISYKGHKQILFLNPTLRILSLQCNEQVVVVN